MEQDEDDGNEMSMGLWRTARSPFLHARGSEEGIEGEVWHLCMLVMESAGVEQWRSQVVVCLCEAQWALFDDKTFSFAFVVPRP